MSHLAFQYNPVYRLKILRTSCILFRIMQPVINGRVHIIYGSLPYSHTFVPCIKEEIYRQLPFSLHMQPFSMDVQCTFIFTLLGFNKSYVTQSSSMFIFVQITNKTLQSFTSNPGFLSQSIPQDVEKYHSFYKSFRLYHL